MLLASAPLQASPSPIVPIGKCPPVGASPPPSPPPALISFPSAILSGFSLPSVPIPRFFLLACRRPPSPSPRFRKRPRDSVCVQASPSPRFVSVPRPPSLICVQASPSLLCLCERPRPSSLLCVSVHVPSSRLQLVRSTVRCEAASCTSDVVVVREVRNSLDGLDASMSGTPESIYQQAKKKKEEEKKKKKKKKKKKEERERRKRRRRRRKNSIGHSNEQTRRMIDDDSELVRGDVGQDEVLAAYVALEPIETAAAAPSPSQLSESRSRKITAETEISFKAKEDFVRLVFDVSPPGSHRARFSRAKVQFRVGTTNDTGALKDDGERQYDFGLGLVGIKHDDPKHRDAIPVIFWGLNDYRHFFTRGTEWNTWYDVGGTVMFRMVAETDESDPKGEHQHLEEDGYEDLGYIPTRREIVGEWGETPSEYDDHTD
ncbi:hypothetical protein DFH29DRAFT_1008277 [Suillus ampliporus]|nr:hypothetical protein DFH29DRAFT_1008277 [Suillus ampliporus]